MNNNVEQIIKKQIRENKLSHAYLIEVNNYSEFDNSLKNILKMLLCEETDEFCNNCQHCKLVDKKIHPNIKYIYPDGTYIKIDQIDELKKSFSTKSSFGKYNIYVMYDADKLNQSSANALLKFLEEPEVGIIGVLLTNKSDAVLPTIYSRCQVYKTDFSKVEYDDEVIRIADYLENLISTKNEILNLKSFIDSIEDKNIIKNAFVYLLDKAISSKDINKIKILKEIVDKIRYNVNIELLIFDYYIRMCNNE